MSDERLPEPLVPAMRPLADYILKMNLAGATARRSAAGMFFEIWGPSPPPPSLESDSEKRAERMRVAREKGRHTQQQWECLLLEFRGRCVRCGCCPTRLERDHIVPIYLGGSDGIENIQPLCKGCNCSKRDETKNWAEYRRLYGFAANDREGAR